MAPHHGSARSNTPALAEWASPRLVVMCQGRNDNTAPAAKAFAGLGSPAWGTWPHGTVTVRAGASVTWAETFRTGLRYPLSPHHP